MATEKASKTEKVTEKKTTPAMKGRYIFKVGRRKSATAKIKFYAKGSGTIIVNGRNLNEYFVTEQQRNQVLEPLNLFDMQKKVDLDITTAGGGLTGQSGAVRLGIARALVELDENNKTTLKQHGMMTRDARVKERKKPGLKRARRAPQWQKR